MNLTGEKDKQYTISEMIDEGGQGAVWRVESERCCVIKTLMNKPGQDGGSQDCDRIVKDADRYEAFARKINSLIALNILFDIPRVALPDEMLQKPWCGYKMRLMEGLESIAKQMRHDDGHMISKADTNGSLKKKLLVLRCLSYILSKLHGQGLVYCDLSPANVFVSQKPSDHEVWLIDSDNLVFANRSKKCIGTPKYRAPEIYKMDSANSFFSDMYSFALIAFEYLTGACPISEQVVSDEDCWDADTVDNPASDNLDDLIERGDAPYMYENGDMGAIVGVPLDHVASKRMQKLFYRTFCEKGRKNPPTRPTANEWCEALDEALNHLGVCPNNHAFIGRDCAWCGKQNDTNKMNVYSIRFQTQVEADNSDWEQNPSPQFKEYISEERYLYHNLSQTDSISIPFKMFSSYDCAGSATIKLSDKKIRFNLDCREGKLKLFKLDDKQDPPRINELDKWEVTVPQVGGKYTLLFKYIGGRRERVITNTLIILERLK